MKIAVIESQKQKKIPQHCKASELDQKQKKYLWKDYADSHPSTTTSRAPSFSSLNFVIFNCTSRISIINISQKSSESTPQSVKANTIIHLRHPSSRKQKIRHFFFHKQQQQYVGQRTTTATTTATWSY
jgi:hypothetical protein